MVMRLSRSRPSSSVSPIRAVVSPTTTPAAPLSCAARTLVAKSHPPLSTNAILYGSTGGVQRTMLEGMQACVSRGATAADPSCPGGGSETKLTNWPEMGRLNGEGMWAGNAAGR